MPADTSSPSDKNRTGKPTGRAGLSDRQARQAAALKANLQRRKQQARARRSSADTEATAAADADGAEEAGPQAEDTPSGR